MAEYLSPGVYLEEFDSGVKAMEGVGTSTAGFVGLAVKGPAEGLPVLVTSFADYQRRFGGYLSERYYGDWRFMPYAVEQFFANGGATCYCMRVCPASAVIAKGQLVVTTDVKKSASDPTPVSKPEQKHTSGNVQASIVTDPKDGKIEGAAANPTGGTVTSPTEGAAANPTGGTAANSTEETAANPSVVNAGADEPFLQVNAANPGSWGNNIVFTLTGILKCKTNFTKIVNKDGDKTFTYQVKSTNGLQAGDWVAIQPGSGGSKADYNIIEKITGENQIELKWDAGEVAETHTLTLMEWNLSVTDDSTVEQYEGVSFNQSRNNYLPNVVALSQLCQVVVGKSVLTKEELTSLIQTLTGEPCCLITLSGGTDPTIDTTLASGFIGTDTDPANRTGIKAFQGLTDVSILAAPGVTDASVQAELVTQCESLGSRFAILDMPFDSKDVSTLQKFREGIDTSYAAMYHPWIQCYDMLSRKNSYFPPSGAMAGIYARTDNSRGVHKAPANEVVRNCTGLSVNYNEAEQGKLNPKGINLIRSLPGQGIRVWGARTCSSDGNWKYVNVRRLFIYIEESIKANTSWAVFEPNDEMLWSRVEGTIKVFLTSLWRNGALMGSSADQAFFVNIGNSTMTQDDILNGRLICVIGVAPVRPAEFVIFRITQKMETAQ